jgi:sulfide dehydrogenase [flavocytochrome c] flavoprotein subunit
VTPGYAFSQSGNYQPRDDIFVEVMGSGFTSPINALGELRQREADQAQSWYKTITVETFG